MAPERASRPIIIVGHDQLALRVCEELQGAADHEAVVLWEHDPNLEQQVHARGARFIARRPDSLDALRAAGIERAAAIMPLSTNDRLNLQVALRARDVNPGVRIVLRQYNRTLGRKVEQNLPNCAVLSLSAYSAATFASAVLDPANFQGIQFPERDGPLLGFAAVNAADVGAGGMSVQAIEERLNARVLSVNGAAANDAEMMCTDNATLIVLRRVVPANVPIEPQVRPEQAPSWQRGSPLQRAVRAVKRADPVRRWYVVFATAVFAVATVFFSYVLHVDPLSAAYFVMTTLTTTGYGDITPKGGGVLAESGALVLMLCGVAITGTFIALLTSELTRMQWVSMQGLRRIRKRGHVIVCGAGNVGSRVVDLLLAFDRQLVVVELNPRPALVETSRDRHFDLLTGDATLDTTLDLCNIEAAAGLVALTENDTMNLEVALSARARNPNMPIVMRVVEGAFAASVRKHFGLQTTFAPAMLAAPAFAGLTVDDFARGRVEIAGEAFGIGEATAGEVTLGDDAVPLCVWRDDRIVYVRERAGVRPDERMLFLNPLRPRSGATSPEYDSAGELVTPQSPGATRLQLPA